LIEKINIYEILRIPHVDPNISLKYTWAKGDSLKLVATNTKLKR